MATRLPGTTIEISALTRDISRQMFDGIFASGGITLSQVSIMTGLEPYLIQNWVKRGFVSSPVKRSYSRRQFSRIVIINMLREALQIDKICELIHIIGGETDDESDDLIGDDELYHRYVNMLSEGNINVSDSESVMEAAKRACGDYDSNIPNARERLARILSVMLYAHYASKLRSSAEELFSTLH